MRMYVAIQQNAIIPTYRKALLECGDGQYGHTHKTRKCMSRAKSDK